MPLTMRESIERASLPLITRLSTLPRVLPFLSLLILLVVGGFIGGPGGFVLIGVAAAFTAWLLYLSWPRLTSSERLMRAAVVLLAAAMATVQLFPRP